MTTRFDNRSVGTFKKDIKFGTMLEKYFFDQWLQRCVNHGFYISKWSDNGCGNDGEFIASGNTAGADYSITGVVKPESQVLATLNNEPLEIKWVPTAGKFTLKENDLKAYVKEEANILFIYNSINCGTDLRKPKDYDFDRHVKLIESKQHQIKWGIMWAGKVKSFYTNAKLNSLFKSIKYMGNKSGIILQQNDFKYWFKEYKW